jgi:signal recognition particle subunit SRP72
MGGPKTHLAKGPASDTKANAPAAAADGKRKFTPRAPAPVTERLPKLYRALTDQVNDGVFDNAKKTCKKSAYHTSHVA